MHSNPQPTVNNAEQSKTGGDYKSEEPLVDGGDAQHKTLTASNDERNEVDEVMKDMRNDAAARDRSRAVIYVATVRPAMAGARYVRTEREGRDEKGASTRGVSVAAVGKAEGPTPQSQLASATEPQELTAVDGDPVIDVPAASRAVDCQKTLTTITGAPTSVADTCGSALSSDASAKQLDDEEMRIAKARLAQKQVRKQAKRERVRRVQAKRRREQQETAAEQRLKLEARQAERRRQAETAMRQLNERRVQQPAIQRTRDGEVVCVSLVQRRRRDDATPAADVVDSVEYVEANDGLPTASVEIAGVRREIKLDSCARYTIAGTEWMQHGDRIECSNPVDYVEGIGGFLLDVIGVWRFRMITVFGEQVTVDACVVDGCTNEFLLGVDFMKARGAIMDFSKGEVRYREEERAVVIPFRTYDESGGARVAAVRVVKKTQLTANSVTRIEVAVPAKDGEQGIFLPTTKIGSVMLAATVTTARGGRAWVPVINGNSAPARLPNKKELGTWVPLEDDMTILAMGGGLSTPRVQRWLNDLGDGDTPLDNEDEVQIGAEEPKDRALMLKLLRVYRKVTTSAGDCPPATILNIQHHIDTGDAAPVLLKRRRQAQVEDEAVDSNVTKMLGAGVIEEGNGAWGFPVVLVRKKDGEIRFCVDYRALNKLTKKDVYPLPRIDETLEALSGALLFTTLDLKAGYWQIMVAPEDRDKTAFVTKKGLYRFVRMPFGLTNAPSTFQRMMNQVLRGLTWSTCLVYLDDIVVFTKGGIERHVMELASVLERLAAAGLTLKLRKCRFAMESMEYLGHELSRDGVRPVQRLLTAVQQFPRSSDAVEAKRFVHLAGYYRRFVAGFGSMMSPITKLLRKGVEWEWTTAQEEAFEMVKEALTNKPLLLYPNFALPFRVATDASTIGLGACLMQDHGKGWQPIAFASKVNSVAESKYSITELECLAVVWAIKLFRPYLYGRTFTILTDHAALKWLMTSNNLPGKLHRWALTLQEYEFDVQYRPGSTNVVADALSRAPAKMLAAVGRRRRTSKRVAAIGGETADVADGVTSATRTPITRREALKRTPDESREVQRYVVEPSEAAEAVMPKKSRAKKTSIVVTTVGTSSATRQPRLEVTTGNEHEPSPPALIHGPRSLRRKEDSRRQTTAVDGRKNEEAGQGQETQTLQLTDDDIRAAQTRSRLVQRMQEDGVYRGMPVTEEFDLIVIKTPKGTRVVLPPSLWPLVFKDCHDSIWAGHLRATHTYARVAQLYWWPNLQREVKMWIRGCQECGSRKARPRDVIPPLRSLRGGDVGDRWALDVAGPLPISGGGQRYVIAAVEYVTRYAVAVTTEEHTAERVAEFLMKSVVLKFGVFRELLTDGAPELTGKAIEQLVLMLQAEQINPVPYRPQMVGLVERFNRTWKDLVATYMPEDRQNDWDVWIDFAVYAYNSGRHSTVALSPNELMLGRRLRPPPNELLRRTSLAEAGELTVYHQKLLAAMKNSHKCAQQAREREQQRQARYYNRRVRARRTFQIGDRVWMFRPPRGPKATKFVHSWAGPMRIVDVAGYDNFLIERQDTEEKREQFIAHVSFLVTYHQPTTLLKQAATDLEAQLEYESQVEREADLEAAGATTRAATAVVRAVTPNRAGKRPRQAVDRKDVWERPSEKLVELRRRRRRNKAGHYVLEYQLQPLRPTPGAPDGDKRWVSISEYDALLEDDRVVEDSESEEGV